MALTKRIDAKANVDSNGQITGYAATFIREPDWANDVIAKGAFADWLSHVHRDGVTVPMLYNHDQSLDSFIGKVTDIHEDDHGLLFTAKFDGTEKAQRARELAMDGRLAKFSFAYTILDQGPVTLEDGRTANELRKLSVDEVSIVLSPCNPDTSVVEVKSEPQTIELHPRIEGLTEEQRKEFTSAISEAIQKGLEIGLKAGRRNSKADEDELRRVLSLAEQITTAINGLLADEDPDADEPDGRPDPDANDEEPDGAKSEEPTETETEELKSARTYAAAYLAALDTIKED